MSFRRFRGRGGDEGGGRVGGPRRSRSPINRGGGENGWTQPRNELDPASIGIKTEERFPERGDMAKKRERGNRTGFVNTGFASGQRRDAPAMERRGVGGFRRFDRGGYSRGGNAQGFGSSNYRRTDDRDSFAGRGFHNANSRAPPSYQRAVDGEERNRAHQMEEPKPVLNLLDPTKVPKGRSYFTHDDREREVGTRTSRGGMRDGGGERGFRGGNTRFSDGGDRRAPIGWRNLDFAQESEGNRRRESRDAWRTGDREGGGTSSRYQRSSEGAWKHDMFADEDGTNEELAQFEKFPDGPELDEQQLADDIRSRAVEGFIVIDEDDEAIAMTLFYTAYSTWQGKFIHMEDLYVRPQFRRQGHGRRLWTEVAKVAWTRNAQRLQWNVLDWNENARQFYDQMAATNLTATEGWVTYRLDRAGIQRLKDQ